MKRIFVLLGVLSIVGAFMVPAALAGKRVDAQKFPIYTATNCSSDQMTGTQVPGHINLVDPMGGVAMIVNGAVTLAPNTTYTFWVRNLTQGFTGDVVNSYTPLGYYALGTFTTDAFGNGEFHYNLLANDLPTGDYTIQVAINTGTLPAPSDAYGCTVAGTTFNAHVTVGS